jgi:hypothetical protein
MWMMAFAGVVAMTLGLAMGLSSPLALPSERFDFEGTSLVVGRGGVRETIGWCLPEEEVALDAATLLLSAARGNLHPNSSALRIGIRESLKSLSPVDIMHVLIGARPPLYSIMGNSSASSASSPCCLTHIQVVIETPVLANVVNGWWDAATYSTATVTITAGGVPSRHMSLFPAPRQK